MSDDLISRQAAIEAAMEELESGTYFDIPSKIKGLPSVQPEILACGEGELVQTGSSDLISRQVAIDAIQRIGRLATLPDNDAVIRMSAVEYVLFNLPSAQPERKQGEWIYVRGEEAGNALYMCSECGKGDIHAPEVKVSYCWNCGADMRGDSDEA